MADVFVSYARADKPRVEPLVRAIEGCGWSVWWDPEISPGREFDDVIDRELQAAKAVLVVWTPTSVVSRWVRGEARDGADRNILVPVRFDAARLPIDVRAINTTDIDDWHEDAAAPCAREFLSALARIVGGRPEARPDRRRKTAVASARRVAICVLPFANMSGDKEQEYFSDGMTEDIITDLSKVSTLAVTSSNTAFRYKGQHADIPLIARDLKVTHVLEGSVRKAGSRIRINAQLIDGATNRHVWAERYDRDAGDIFEVQDEISHAIVSALQLTLRPAERRAIDRRDTENTAAHDLFLMARRLYVTNPEGDERSARAIVRMCEEATRLDANYAQAWALMAAGHLKLGWLKGDSASAGMAAVEEALRLSPDLAEAHAVKAQILLLNGAADAAASEVATALALAPESYEVNRSAGRLNYQLHRFDEAIRYFDKAVTMMDGDINSAIMLTASCAAVEDAAGVQRAAALALARAEAVLAHDQNNLGAMAYSAYACAAVGQVDRAKAWMSRTLLMEPDDFSTRYNFGCILTRFSHDTEAALDMLEPAFEMISAAFLPYASADPDLATLREAPRFKAMLAKAEARLAVVPAPAAGAA